MRICEFTVTTVSEPDIVVKVVECAPVTVDLDQLVFWNLDLKAITFSHPTLRPQTPGPPVPQPVGGIGRLQRDLGATVGAIFCPSSARRLSTLVMVSMC